MDTKQANIHSFPFFLLHIFLFYRKEKKMRTSKALLYSLSLVSLAALPTLQHQTAKGPQFPLQEPAPVNFVQNILSTEDAKDYCNVSTTWPIAFLCSSSRTNFTDMVSRL